METLFGGASAAIVFAVIFVLAVFWTVFPVFVYFQLKRIEEHIDRTSTMLQAQLHRVVQNTGRTADTLENRNVVVEPDPAQ